MKKILLTMALCAGLSTAKDVEVFRYQNEMTDKVIYYPSSDIILKEGNKGFRVTLQIDNDMFPIGILVYHLRLGRCGENDELIIMVESGQKVKLKSWNRFNCDGDSWYNLTNQDLEILKSNPIKKIMFRNGRTYDSLTKEVAEIDKNYFIDLFSLLSKKEYKEVKK